MNQSFRSTRRNLALAAFAAIIPWMGCGGGERKKPETPAPAKGPATPAKAAETPAAKTPSEPSAAAKPVPALPEPTQIPAPEVNQPAASAPSGVIQGAVTFDGEPPKRTVIKMDADAQCAAIHAGSKVGSEDALVNKEGRVANVFVYVQSGLEGKSFPVPAQAVELDQKGCMYSPRVVGLRVDQPLELVSSDPTLHNIHCMAKINPEFNFGMPGPGKREKIFKKAEIGVQFKCDVHPWMGAWVHVIEHPFFSVTNPKGEFAISGLPPGDYTLVAWHEKFGTRELAVKLGEAGAGGVDFKFAAPEKR